MAFVFYFIVFILGSVVGSFLNCVIYRLAEGSPRGIPRGLPSVSFLRGRSFCPHCKHQLGLWDLIPIVSFIALRAKCRYCQKKISFQYPAVEISTGLLFLLILNFQFDRFAVILSEAKDLLSTGFLASLGMTVAVSCFLIVIFVYDLKHYIIPDKIIYPAIAITLFYKVISNFQFPISSEFSISNFQISALLGAVLSALGASAFFFIIWAVSRGKWLGFGDVKLAFLMGLFLGWPNILVGMFSAFFIGAIIGTGLIALGKKKLKSQVPFGPFLITGTFIALFWGERIVEWYFGLI